ncbi:MAG: hypothetical protein JXR70_09290 [Spirochaetales bacterium]|nr:hypothetical protein [Spirochaetales bacterium]
MILHWILRALPAAQGQGRPGFPGLRFASTKMAAKKRGHFVDSACFEKQACPLPILNALKAIKNCH